MEGLLTGIRLGGAILWLWVLFRVAFESWQITEAPDHIRRKGWIYFRRFLALMAFSIVFLFSPENILRAGGHITEATGFVMLAIGAFNMMVCAVMIHHGMDIVAQRPPSTVVIYFVIILLSLAYSVMGI